MKIINKTEIFQISRKLKTIQLKNMTNLTSIWSDENGLKVNEYKLEKVSIRRCKIEKLRVECLCLVISVCLIAMFY